MKKKKVQRVPPPIPGAEQLKRARKVVAVRSWKRDLMADEMRRHYQLEKERVEVALFGRLSEHARHSLHDRKAEIARSLGEMYR